MAWTVTVGGVNRTSVVRVDTLGIRDVINQRSTCQFVVDRPAGAGWSVTPGLDVTVDDGTGVVFGGRVARVAEAAQPDDSLIVDVDCVDWHLLFDRRLAIKVYENELAGDIAADLVTSYLAGDGVTSTAVQDGPTLERVVFSYVSVTEAMNRLATLTGFSWYVDASKDLHFFARETNTAPEALTDSSQNWDEIAVDRSLTGYRNKQYQRGGWDTTSPRTESFKGDGTVRVWNVAFPVWEVPTVTVNAVSKTVGIGGITSGKNFYWNKGRTEISQDLADTVLSTSDTLAVTYVGAFPLIVVADDSAAIAERVSVEGGTGVYEAINVDKSLDSNALVTEYALALLRRHGRIPRTVQFTTTTTGFRAGQLVEITNTPHGLSGSWLIESVQAQDVNGVEIRYRVQAADGEGVGGWHDFFAQLAAAALAAHRDATATDEELLLLVRSLADTVSFDDLVTVTTPARAAAVWDVSIVGEAVWT